MKRLILALAVGVAALSFAGTASAGPVCAPVCAPVVYTPPAVYAPAPVVYPAAPVCNTWVTPQYRSYYTPRYHYSRSYSRGCGWSRGCR